MAIKIGSISAKDIYIGSTPAKEIRLGSTLVWSREPELKYHTLTINLGEGVDYSDILYREPGETEWAEASKFTSITTLAGTEFYVIAGLYDGYVLDENVNLGSPSNPLILNTDTVIDIMAYTPALEQYEFNVVSEYGLQDLTIKIGDDVVYDRHSHTDDIFGTDTSIIHDGSKPIYVDFACIGSFSGHEWSGNVEPHILDNTTYDFYWDNLYESGTLTIMFSS